MDCTECKGAGVELVYGGNGNVLEFACSYCQPNIEEVLRLRRVEDACKRLAYIVRKSVNSGPLSNDPTQEAAAWRKLRIELGEGYDHHYSLD